MSYRLSPKGLESFGLGIFGCIYNLLGNIITSFYPHSDLLEFYFFIIMFMN